MPQLLVRNLEEKVVRALKLKAARNGRSAEAEHRHILRQAVLGDEQTQDMKQILLEMPDVGLDSDFERQKDLGREVDF